MAEDSRVYHQGLSEEEPLLSSGTHKSRRSRLTQYLNQEIDRSWADLILLFCYIITGLLDSSAIFIWGSFVSMQTGNTVYLGLGVAGVEPGGRWIKSGISIASFCLGSLFFGGFHRYFSPKRRWVLCASFSTQLVFIVIAALIVSIRKPAKHQYTKPQWEELAPLALIAFQSSGQAVTSRVLKFTGLTSVVLTSVYCDLFSSPDFLTLHLFSNVEERQRAGAVVSVLIGTFMGGFWARSETGLAGALWTAASFKAGIAVAWLGWRATGEEWISSR